MEEFEYHDWNITNTTDIKEQMHQSISSYWLDKWYNKLPKDLTTETYIYPIITTLEQVCPDVLPFTECMVRYENKSPKDSEYWGKITNKEQLLKVFYTSLRCKTNPGSKLCIRRWRSDFVGEEIRCFWNRRLVALCSVVATKPNIEHIIKYILNIAQYIPYYRCIFDIIQLSTGEYHLVEFNSWETNSGAHLFNWIDDTDILYPSVENQEIHFRWGTKSDISSHVITINQELKPILSSISDQFNLNHSITFNDKPVDLVILKPTGPSYSIIADPKITAFISDVNIYVMNDIYLYRFDANLKLLAQKRENCRFENLYLYENGTLSIGLQKYYHYDLTPIRPHKLKSVNNTTDQLYRTHPLLKYGFYCWYQDKLWFCRVNYDATFTCHI